MMNAKKWTDKREAIQDKLSEISQELQEVLNEVQETFDSRSEKWQESDRGQAMEEFIGNLEEAVSEVEVSLPEWPV